MSVNSCLRYLRATVVPLGLMLGACGGSPVAVETAALEEACPPPPPVCPPECMTDCTSDYCKQLVEDGVCEPPPPPPPPPPRLKCNQGVGNGPEGCDPGNSNNQNSSNDENGGVPGEPGRQGPK